MREIDTCRSAPRLRRRALTGPRGSGFLAAFVVVTGWFAAGAARAQLPGPPLHVVEYEEATLQEEEALRLRGQGQTAEAITALHACLQLARASDAHSPNELAVWRVASCAGAMEHWSLVRFAAEVFWSRWRRRLEEFAHPSIGATESASVLRFVTTMRHRVGSLRMDLPPDVAFESESGIAPLVVAPGALPPLGTPEDVELLRSRNVLVDGVVYGNSATEWRVRAGAAGPWIGVRFQPLERGTGSLAAVLLPAQLDRTRVRDAIDGLGDRPAACVVRSVRLRLLVAPSGRTETVEPIAGQLSAAQLRCLRDLLAPLRYPAFRQSASQAYEFAVIPSRPAELRPVAEAQPSPRFRRRSPPDKIVAAPREPEDDGANVARDVFLWGGVSVAVVGGVFAYLANQIATDLDAACPTRTGCSPDLRDDAARGQRFMTTGNVLLGGGGALAGVGLIWLFASSGAQSANSRVSARFVPVARGGVVVTEGRF